jgi:hypothetical protein
MRLEEFPVRLVRDGRTVLEISPAKRDRKDYRRAWYAKNRLVRRAWLRAWREKNKDHLNAYHRAWRAEHRDRAHVQNIRRRNKKRAYDRDYYARHRDQIRARQNALAKAKRGEASNPNRRSAQELRGGLAAP